TNSGSVSMMLILLMAAAVSCSTINPMLHQPSGGMPDDMGASRKNIFSGKPVAPLKLCPGTLSTVCPIEPTILPWHAKPVTFLPAGWKICPNKVGLCPIHPRVRRPKVRPSMRFSKDSGVGRLRGIPSYYFKKGSSVGRSGGRSTYNFPKDSRVGLPDGRKIIFPESQPMTYNKRMVPCKDRMGMCFPEN
ncbi:unnamed protein product, partial [Meganyctiphanes norvegica]